MNPQLTDLQKNALRILLAHRYYNAWSTEPTALVTQAELAHELHASQADISNALKRLTAAGYIRPLWKARKGQPQLYAIAWPGHASRPDTRRRYKLMQQTVPDRHQVNRARSWRNAPRETAPQETDDPAMTEAQADAAAAAMLREDPELEGWPDDTENHEGNPEEWTDDAVAIRYGRH